VRDLAIVIADQEIRAVVTALLRRRWHSLGIRPLDFDPQEDALVEAGRDSGCYLRGAALLAPRRKTHLHGLILLDEKWGGTPGREAIERKMTEELLKDGWDADAAVVVLSPELEIWAFVQSDHLARSLRWPELNGPIRDWLGARGEWPDGMPKPPCPKEALHKCARQGAVRITPHWFEDFAGGQVGLTSCTDRSFLRFRDVLRRWFPPHGSQP
jgi:hypothetical protein